MAPPQMSGGAPSSSSSSSSPPSSRDSVPAADDRAASGGGGNRPLFSTRRLSGRGRLRSPRVSPQNSGVSSSSPANGGGGGNRGGGGGTDGGGLGGGGGGGNGGPPHRSASAPIAYTTNGTGAVGGYGEEIAQHREAQWPRRRSSDVGHPGGSPGAPSSPSGPSSFAAATLRSLQDVLDFKVRDPERHWQFADKTGLGRVATLACLLGLILGAHSMLLLLLGAHRLGWSAVSLLDDVDPARVRLLEQWVVYVVLLCTFHLSEFFVTAVWNPAVATADSFVVNQSSAYTAAALASWLEFWARFAFIPGVNSTATMVVGLGLVLMGQACRTMAMVTCGENFNHLIQLAKKSNHRLVTHGIYRHLRHPSYFGFYWWSVGTQLLLGNPLCAALYAVASWSFFRRRIPYEEATLLRHFPDEYPAYVRRSRIGIPFVRGAEAAGAEATAEAGAGGSSSAEEAKKSR